MTDLFTKKLLLIIANFLSFIATGVLHYVCVYFPVVALNQLTDFHKTWYEHFLLEACLPLHFLLNSFCK
jgi:hypothetical protein